MYYPYFRGKQFELIAIRENASLLASAKITPIIEPVREALNPVKRALDAIVEAAGRAIFIVNPDCGDLIGKNDEISDFLTQQFDGNRNIIAGILLTEKVSLDNVKSLIEAHKNREIAFIHAGFSDAKPLASFLAAQELYPIHVFHDESCGRLYRMHFKSHRRVLVRDGFEKRKSNREHPEVEFFSDLHVTYSDEGMNGFGDFLIVGDDYSEGGGPAYTVAIHITFIDQEKDGEMHIHHFKSDRQDSPIDAAGKFSEALSKLKADLDNKTSKILKTKAIEEFLKLESNGHFPGLGFVKKLSMQHHIETIADFIDTKKQQQ